MNRTRFLSLFIVAMMFVCLGWAALAPAPSQPSSRLALPTMVAPDSPLGAAGQLGQ